MKINVPLMKGLFATRKVKQWQICHNIGISEAYFSRIMTEKAVPSEGLLSKIAQALGVRSKDLIVEGK